MNSRGTPLTTTKSSSRRSTTTTRTSLTVQLSWTPALTRSASRSATVRWPPCRSPPPLPSRLEPPLRRTPASHGREPARGPRSTAPRWPARADRAPQRRAGHLVAALAGPSSDGESRTCASGRQQPATGAQQRPPPADDHRPGPGHLLHQHLAPSMPPAGSLLGVNRTAVGRAVRRPGHSGRPARRRTAGAACARWQQSAYAARQGVVPRPE